MGREGMSLRVQTDCIGPRNLVVQLGEDQTRAFYRDVLAVVINLTVEAPTQHVEPVVTVPSVVFPH